MLSTLFEFEIMNHKARQFSGEAGGTQADSWYESNDESMAKLFITELVPARDKSLCKASLKLVFLLAATILKKCLWYINAPVLCNKPTDSMYSFSISLWNENINLVTWTDLQFWKRLNQNSQRFLSLAK